MDDVIMERSDQGKCPLCNKDLGEDFKRALYKGKKIWICNRHSSPAQDFNAEQKAEG